MNVEVLSLEHPKIKTLVLNLVAAEVLGVQGQRNGRQGQRDEPESAAVAAMGG